MAKQKLLHEGHDQVPHASTLTRSVQMAAGGCLNSVAVTCKEGRLHGKGGRWICPV